MYSWYHISGDVGYWHQERIRLTNLGLTMMREDNNEMRICNHAEGGHAALHTTAPPRDYLGAGTQVLESGTTHLDTFEKDIEVQDTERTHSAFLPTLPSSVGFRCRLEGRRRSMGAEVVRWAATRSSVSRVKVMLVISEALRICLAFCKSSLGHWAVRALWVAVAARCLWLLRPRLRAAVRGLDDVSDQIRETRSSGEAA